MPHRVGTLVLIQKHVMSNFKKDDFNVFLEDAFLWENRGLTSEDFEDSVPQSFLLEIYLPFYSWRGLPKNEEGNQTGGNKASGWPKLPMWCIREVTRENNKTRQGLWYECAPLLSFWGNCWPWVIIRKRCEPQIKIQNQQQLGSWDYPKVMRRDSLRWGARQHRGGEEPSLQGEGRGLGDWLAWKSSGKLHPSRLQSFSGCHLGMENRCFLSLAEGRGRVSQSCKGKGWQAQRTRGQLTMAGSMGTGRWDWRASWPQWGWPREGWALAKGTIRGETQSHFCLRGFLAWAGEADGKQWCGACTVLKEECDGLKESQCCEVREGTWTGGGFASGSPTMQWLVGCQVRGRGQDQDGSQVLGLGNWGDDGGMHGGQEQKRKGGLAGAMPRSPHTA